MGYPVLLSRRPRRDGRRRAPTVGFAPSAIGAFDAAVNTTYRVRASPKAAGVYAEGYVLVCAGFEHARWCVRTCAFVSWLGIRFVVLLLLVVAGGGEGVGQSEPRCCALRTC